MVATELAPSTMSLVPFAMDVLAAKVAWLELNFPTTVVTEHAQWTGERYWANGLQVVPQDPVQFHLRLQSIMVTDKELVVLENCFLFNHLLYSMIYALRPQQLKLYYADNFSMICVSVTQDWFACFSLHIGDMKPPSFAVLCFGEAFECPCFPCRFEHYPDTSFLMYWPRR